MQHFHLDDKHFRKVGNGYGMLIPVHILYILGWHTGTRLKIDTTDDQIIITGPKRSKPQPLPPVNLFANLKAPSDE